ncbi:MAG: hydrolase, partial [Bacteroidia bacterium]|nr:hydrolase [Bacteroidia bacterium]
MVCEHEESPLLVEGETPRFGWQLQSTENGVEQTAYEIEIFDNKNQRIWNSGKIKSDKSQHIPYAGKTKLNSGEKYQWRVRVWDNKNKSTHWSEK